MLVDQLQRRMRDLGRFRAERKDLVESAACHIRFDEFRVVTHQRHLAVIEVAEGQTAKIEVPGVWVVLIAVAQRIHLLAGFEDFAVAWSRRLDDVWQAWLWSATNHF